MFDLVLKAQNWDLSRISTRVTQTSGVGPVSGHNGELLGVMADALGSFVKHGDPEYSQKAASAIECELKREADEFEFVLSQPGREIDLLRLAAILTHNRSDLDQGISFWPANAVCDSYRQFFGRLAHENTAPYGGIYQIAALFTKTSSRRKSALPITRCSLPETFTRLSASSRPFFRRLGRMHRYAPGTLNG